MQNDVRLIDANDVVTIQVFDEMTEEYFMQTMTIAEMIDRWADEGCPPTIDAVPLVRCKDCKNRGTPYSCPMRKLVMPFQGAGSYEDCTEDNGYCHMGVKKDGGCSDG